MRVLTLILILAISAQPVQAGFCMMDRAAGQSMDNTQMMDAGIPGSHDSGSHDCCETGQPDSDDACEGGSHCGACTVGASLLPLVPRIAPAWSNDFALSFTAGEVLPSHASPPYRPPIS